MSTIVGFGSPGIRLGFSPAAAGIGPLDPLSLVTSVARRFYVVGDVGITLATGVSAWADQSGNGYDAANATGGSQPAYNASGLGGRGILTFDGVDDWLNFSTVPTPAPATTNSWYWIVFNSIGNATAATIFASNNTNRHRLFWSNTSAMNHNSGTSGTTMARSTNAWYRGEVFFNNAVSSYKKIGNQSNTGIDTGNNAGVAGNFTVGANSVAAGNPVNVAVAAFGCWDGEPTSGEKSALDQWVTDYYGGLVQV